MRQRGGGGASCVRHNEHQRQAWLCGFSAANRRRSFRDCIAAFAGAVACSGSVPSRQDARRPLDERARGTRRGRGVRTLHRLVPVAQWSLAHRRFCWIWGLQWRGRRWARVRRKHPGGKSVRRPGGDRLRGMASVPDISGPSSALHVCAAATLCACGNASLTILSLRRDLPTATPLNSNRCGRWPFASMCSRWKRLPLFPGYSPRWHAKAYPNWSSLPCPAFWVSPTQRATAPTSSSRSTAPPRLMPSTSVMCVSTYGAPGKLGPLIRTLLGFSIGSGTGTETSSSVVIPRSDKLCPVTPRPRSSQHRPNASRATLHAPAGPARSSNAAASRADSRLTRGDAVNDVVRGGLRSVRGPRPAGADGSGSSHRSPFQMPNAWSVYPIAFDPDVECCRAVRRPRPITCSCECDLIVRPLVVAAGPSRFPIVPKPVAYKIVGTVV